MNREERFQIAKLIEKTLEIPAESVGVVICQTRHPGIVEVRTSTTMSSNQLRKTLAKSCA